jgi:hypothetical protein
MLKYKDPQTCPTCGADLNASTENPARRYLSIQEVAHLYSLAESTVYQAFRNEPGVLRFKPPGYKRAVLRIPEDVVERVIRRCTVPALRK